MQSESIDKLLVALSSAHKQFKPIEKKNTANNGKFSYQYANLVDILSAVLPALHANGLILTQAPEDHERGSTLRTRIYHVSGQWLESTMPLRTGDEPRTVGSNLSYFRRYSIISLLSLAPDSSEDDDGFLATPNKKKGSELNAKYGVSNRGQDATF